MDQSIAPIRNGALRYYDEATEYYDGGVWREIYPEDES